MIRNYLEPLDRKWIWDDLGIGSIGIYRDVGGHWDTSDLGGI